MDTRKLALRRSGRVARRYLAPLIRGGAPAPSGRDGLPRHAEFKRIAVHKKPTPWKSR